MKTSLGLLAIGLLVSCGGSTSNDGGGSAGKDAGSGGAGAAGGMGASAGLSGSGGGVSGGGGGAPGGAGGAPGGSGGVAGAPSGDCAGLSYCDCTQNAACQVLSEPCFCPCGVEPCEPTCDCKCAGGKYLGCAPTSIMDPGALEGLWLVGWSGGMNHFSWVRLEPNGVATFNDGANLSVNGPFWPCSGSGSWGLAAKPETIALYLPTACGTMTAISFTQFTGKPAWPSGCLLAANIEMIPGGGGMQMACKYPLSTCDATLSSCQDVLK